MEQLLRPWLAQADALLSPQWRAALRDDRAIRLAQREPLARDQQLRLRETLELLARALLVDAGQLSALVDAKATTQSQLNASRTQPIENIRLLIEADNHNTVSHVLFQGWREDSASESFRETKTRLEALARGSLGVARLELELELRIVPTSKRSLRGMLDLVEGVDRRVFRVTEISITFVTADLEPRSLAALMAAVHRHTNTTRVKIHLELPSRPVQRLMDWKRVFDATLKASYPATASRNAWDVVVSSDDSNDDADARITAACFSALAHAADYVTSIELRNLLGASNDKDAYNPTDRRVRAKWLGYLLRTSAVKSVAIHETQADQDDMDTIALTLQAPSEERCLEALWSQDWHNSQNQTQEPQAVRDDPSELDHDQFEQLDPDDIVGVMRAGTATDLSVDVLVVGYGQCTVPHSVVAQVAEKTQTSASREDPGVTSLRICLSEGEGTEGHLLRFVMLLGNDLEQLVLDASHSQIALSVLIVVLASCPRLKRLDIKSIYLNTGDDEPLFLPTHWANHPLEELSVDLNLNEAAVGLSGLASTLVLFGVQLKALRIHAEPPMETNLAAKSAIQTMLRTCGTSLHTLEVIGLSVEYFLGIFSPDALGLHQLATLKISDVASNRSVWQMMMTTLTQSDHPLTRTLQKLHIHIEKIPEIAEMTAYMLETNALLVDCQFVWRSQRAPPLSLFKTHGRALQRRKALLSLHQKIAFLSSVERSVVPWESSVLGKIFAFAAPTETRSVDFSSPA